MISFWIATALVSVAAVAVVLWRARRGPAEAGAAPEAEVYRRHLEELSALKARGLLDEAGFADARAEAGRRLLRAAGGAATVETAPRPIRDRRVVFAAAAASALGAMAIYAVLGDPGYVDQPFAARLDQWTRQAQADPASLPPEQLAKVLERRAEGRETDPRFWFLLGEVRAQAGDAIGAAQAYETALRADPNRAEAWVGLGQALVQLGEGRVEGQAVDAFRRALALDPGSTVARYFLGRGEIDAGRRAEGVALWRSLLAELPPSDTRRAALEADIARAEAGPSQAEAVASADPREQRQMIVAMVQTLADRLEANPDDPQGWARLVRSYKVLNDGEGVEYALTRARALFRDRPADLALVEAAARDEAPR